jgi:hypothetical protein
MAFLRSESAGRRTYNQQNKHKVQGRKEERREGGREGGREGRRPDLRGAGADGLIPFPGRGGLALSSHVVCRVHQVAGTGATETGAAGTGKLEARFVAHLGRKKEGGEGGREGRKELTCDLGSSC